MPDFKAKMHLILGSLQCSPEPKAIFKGKR